MSREAAEKFIATRPNRLTIDAYTASLEAKNRITPIVQESIDKARAVRLGHRLVFYIAGGLTGVSGEVKQRYVDLSELVASHDKPEVNMFGYAPHLHGTDPVKHPNVSANEVRDIDYLWAAVVSDGHFNSLDPVAHGNAIEEGWAEEHDIPAVYLVPEGMTTSRLVRGMHNIIDTVVYADFRDDCLPRIDALLTGVEERLGLNVWGLEKVTRHFNRHLTPGAVL